MLPSKRVLTDLVGSVYEAAGDVSLWEAFLGRLAQTTRAESAALVVHELGPELHSLAAAWMVDPEASRLYQQHYGAVDVWALRGRCKPPGYVCTSESLCSLEEMAGTEIYNDFMVRFGITHGMFGCIENDHGRRWGSVSFYRGPSSKEFRTSDLETLNLLIPHIRRAFTLHFRFSELKTHAEGVETALNMLAVGVLLVGSRGEVVLMNRRAEDLLSPQDGLLMNRGRLSASLDAESARLRAMIDGAIRTGNGNGLSAGGSMLVSRESRRPLSVTVAPLRKLSVGWGEQPSAVLFISDPEWNVELPADWLQRCYELTRAEARLTMILLSGCSLKQGADRCGVSHNTAKSQLKSIFLKTNVRRQGELIRLLLTSSGTVRSPQSHLPMA